ncbi:MAG: two pore domain potassium channel family protein [Proteobacteria bacterium]|nr:two pore domain potassium channel family protein [Pseudomonadota bacterium]
MIYETLRSLLKHRFGVLLFLQVLMLQAAAFAQGSLFKEEIFLLALLGMLMASGFVILKGTRYLVQFLIVAFCALVANLFGYFSSSSMADVSASFANLVFMVWVLIAMVSRVFFDRKVDENIILGAACLYIHIGMTFGFIYLMVDYFAPGSFNSVINIGAPAEISRLLGHFLYYSFVTLSTVGYGDIAPISPPARYISVLEAIIGQLYLAIMVSRLLGMHINNPKK